MTGKTSDAQKRASTKWNKKNKEKMDKIRGKSASKKYIEKCNIKELQELEEMIEERRRILEENE